MIVVKIHRFKIWSVVCHFRWNCRIVVCSDAIFNQSHILYSYLSGLLLGYLAIHFIDLMLRSSPGRYGQIYPIYPKELTTFRPRRNGHHFAVDIFKRTFFNENVLIAIKISLKIVPKGPINIILTLAKITDDKPLCEPMMVSLPTNICVTQSQWVKDMTKQ